MKRSILIALVSLFTVRANAQGQSRIRKELEASDSKTNFAVNVQPLYLLVGALAGEVEVPAGESISIIGGGLYMPSRSNISESSSSSSGTTYNYKMKSYEAYLGAKFMLTGDTSHSGIYAAPSLGYYSLSISDFGTERLSGSISAPELRALAGYQWVLPTRFRISAGLGLRSLQASDIVIKDSTGKEVYREKATSLSGLALDLGFGYTF